MLNKEEVQNLNNLESTTTSIEGSLDSKILTSGSLGSGDSADYSLRIWMDESVTIDDTDAINKQLLSKVTVTAVPSSYSPVANGFTNLAEALLVNEYQTTDVQVAKDKIASKQEVDTTKTAPLIDWKSIIKYTSVTTSVTKADPALIGQYGITAGTTKIRFGRSYTFDSETAYYTLQDKEYLMPTEVDYENGDYYFCSSSIIASNTNTLGGWDASDCSSLYKVEKVDSVVDGNITLSSGDVVTTKKYSLVVTILGSEEVENDKSDKGIYITEDDYGTTYYYRGNVTNNYVKFGEYYWRVIRINGDGSVRMIYSGTSPSATSGELTIGVSAYNTNRDNPTYVGYMYSNTLNSSYKETIQNDVSSTVKTTLDNWYKTNIYDKGYSNYIADSGFCNDRSLDTNETGDGYTTVTSSYYAPRYRLLNSVPSLLCPNKSNDLFTLSGNDNGNEALTYPVGLITSDELLYAGLVFKKVNPMSYLSTDFYYLTMSPYSHEVSGDSSRVIMFTQNTVANTNVDPVRRVRPVINLKADTEISGGIGTANNPFVVK